MKLANSAGVIGRMTAPCAIIGSGNIGTDLMYKMQRSDLVDLVALIEIDPDSDGLARARSLGYEAPHNGIDWVRENPGAVEIVFDATSAYVHRKHDEVLQELGITAIDLNTGEHAWMVPLGTTPDFVRNHPALKGLTIPRTGRGGLVGVLTTGSLVIAGERGTYTDEQGRNAARLRAYDKATGKEVGAVFMPTGQTGSPK